MRIWDKRPKIVPCPQHFSVICIRRQGINLDIFLGDTAWVGGGGRQKIIAGFISTEYGTRPNLKWESHACIEPETNFLGVLPILWRLRCHGLKQAFLRGNNVWNVGHKIVLVLIVYLRNMVDFKVEIPWVGDTKNVNRLDTFPFGNTSSSRDCTKTLSLNILQFTKILLTLT